MKLRSLVAAVPLIVSLGACGDPQGSNPGVGGGVAKQGTGGAAGHTGAGGAKSMGPGGAGGQVLGPAPGTGGAGGSPQGGSLGTTAVGGGSGLGSGGSSGSGGPGGSNGLFGQGGSSVAVGTGGLGGSAASHEGSGGVTATGGVTALPGSGGSNGSGGTAGGSGGAPSAMTGGSGGSSPPPGSGGVPDVAGSGGAPAAPGSGGVAVPPDGSGGSAPPAGSGGSPAATGGTASGGVSGSGGSAGVSGSGGSTSGSGGNDADPQYLFTTEQFGGNGRTCTTCHIPGTGTVTPAQIQALFSANPSDPMFRPIDSDDGASTNYTLLQQRATFRVTINLPAGVTLASDPSATTIVLRRSVPTTINTPALDPVLMWDGRAADLSQQALGAIQGHAQATIVPTATELSLIGQFEHGSSFFSSTALYQYSQGGPAPDLPPGNTPEEQRGRQWFVADPAAPGFNVCGKCHSGVMANEEFFTAGTPAQRFETVDVSEFNTLGNPTFQFTFPDPNNPGQTLTVATPDPGRALVTGDVNDLNRFKIPPLWGIKNTAPYFHDNSAADLAALMGHYEKFLSIAFPVSASYPTPHAPNAQDKADIIAYLNLL